MRSWSGASRSLARVVTITHDRSHPSAPTPSISRPSGTFHTSQSPANAIGSPSRRWMNVGCFFGLPFGVDGGATTFHS